MRVGRIEHEPAYGGKKTYEPDWKNSKRVSDKKAARSVHSAGCYCVLNCGAPGEAHHVLFKSQGGDDDPANLVCLCVEHHDLIHAEDFFTKIALGEYLLAERPDTVAYLTSRKGVYWLSRRLLMK